METIKKVFARTVSAAFACIVLMLSSAPSLCYADHLNNPAYNPNYQRIGHRTINKKRTVGDCDDNGTIDMNDAALINQWCLYYDFGETKSILGTLVLRVNSSQYFDYSSDASVEFMDINGDGRVTNVDATLLKRYLIDLKKYNDAVNN